MTKTETKIANAFSETGLAINGGASLRYGWHYGAKGRRQHGWGRYSAAGECVYLGGSARKAIKCAAEERAEITRQTGDLTVADLERTYA